MQASIIHQLDQRRSVVSQPSAKQASQLRSAAEDEIVDFAEENFIRLHALNAKRDGQALSVATKKKLSRLAELIQTVLRSGGDSR